MTASPASRRRASARLVTVAAARRLPSRISTTSEDANEEEDRSMPRRKKHSLEEIVAELRQVEVAAGQGTPVADAVRSIGATEATY